MKKLLRRLSGYIVTIYANRIYRKAVNEADKAHKKLKERIYVVSSWGDISHLVVLNRGQFRKMKRALNAKGNISDLIEGAWYFTADRADKGGMSAKDKEVRRLAFVRHLLERAKLV